MKQCAIWEGRVSNGTQVLPRRLIEVEGVAVVPAANPALPAF